MRRHKIVHGDNRHIGCCCSFAMAIPFVLALAIAFSSFSHYGFHTNESGHDVSFISYNSVFGTISKYIPILANGVTPENQLGKHRITLSDKSHDEIVEHEAKTSLLFHPTVSHLVGNHSRNMCSEPFEWVCEHGEKSMKTIIEENNVLILNKILYQSDLTVAPFVKTCRAFHSKTMAAKYDEIISNLPLISHYWSLLENLNVENVTSVYDIYSSLHKSGVREPYRLIKMASEELRFSQSERLAQIPVHYINEFLYAFTLKYASFFSSELTPREIASQMARNYELISRTITIAQTDETRAREVYLKAHKITAKTHFQLHHFIEKRVHIVGETQNTHHISDPSIQVDLYLLGKFHSAISQFSSDQWRDYFWVASMKSLLYQTRALSKMDWRICFSQLKQYFPLTVCRKFKTMVQEPPDLPYLKKYYVEGFTRIILTENYFKFPPKTIDFLRKKLNEMEIQMNHCAVLHTNETMTTLEDKYLWMKDTSYVDTIWKLMSESDFRERRNIEYKILSSELIDDYLHWNAFYIFSRNTMIFGPGILSFPLKFTKPAGPIYHALIDHPAMHEFTHFLHFQLYLVDKSEISIEWQRFSDDIRMKYRTLEEVKHRENLADGEGLRLAYNTWVNKRHRSLEEKRTFILSYIRTFCDAPTHEEDETGRPKDVHASGKQRALIPLQTIRSEFEMVFNCTSPAVLSF